MILSWLRLGLASCLFIVPVGIFNIYMPLSHDAAMDLFAFLAIYLGWEVVDLIPYVNEFFAYLKEKFGDGVEKWIALLRFLLALCIFVVPVVVYNHYVPLSQEAVTIFLTLLAILCGWAGVAFFHKVSTQKVREIDTFKMSLFNR